MRLSIAQIETKLNDKAYNLAKIERFLHEAKEHKSDLVLFPELGLTGYSIGPWLDEAAETPDGESVQHVQSLCKKLAIHTIFSFPERGQDGNYYVATVFINDQGEVVALHRKTHLYGEEQVHFTCGDEVQVFQSKFGVIGIMSSYDLEFPEIARILSKKGADLILIPSTNMAPYKTHQLAFTQCRAMENEVPLALCNRIGKEGDIEFIGCSSFVDAQGVTHLLLSNQEELHTIPVLLFKSADSKLDYILNNQPHLFKELC
ncbi:carbon-nitrogen hydrolase family protein [Brevibacillus fluminis]|uniref:carbon-nitrogen hydrolase family protein n=1 Tax=Brevibacillus fluminis TaxID=511487 RepID=UPI0016067C90|nr:carbon-nitrogen hydrolase family protein [Brevibacillus fluminis]